MRVLITGATGFAGGWLAQELAAASSEMVLFGMAHQGGTLSVGVPITVQAADLAQPDSLRSLLTVADPDVVFHLAGFASGAGTDRDRIFRINVEGTVNLLQLLTEQGKPCRVLLASSGYIYGATEPGKPAKETDPIRAAGAYAESKAAMEVAAQPFAHGGLLSLTVVRSFNHTGPRQSPDFAVPAFARQIAQIEQGLGEPVVRHGNLEAVRDFLDVRDVVRAYRLLVLEAEPVPWRVVNVASGRGVVMRELLERLLAQATVTVSHEPDPARMRPSDLPVNLGSPETLHQLTGWEATVPLEQTLFDTLNYWREEARSS